MKLIAKYHLLVFSCISFLSTRTQLLSWKNYFFLKFGQSVTSQLSFTTSESAVSNSMPSLGVSSSTQVGLTFSEVTGIIFNLCLRIYVTIMYNDKSVATLQSSIEIRVLSLWWKCLLRSVSSYNHIRLL